jgi:hypothetical protein
MRFSNGFKIKAPEETGDLYLLPTWCRIKLKQVKRYRDKVKDHKPEDKPNCFAGNPAAEELELRAGPQIIKAKGNFANPWMWKKPCSLSYPPANFWL